MQSIAKPKKGAQQLNFIGKNLFQKKDDKPLPEQGTYHQERKKAILAKYPQVRELCKPDWKMTLPFTWAYMAAHLTLSYLISKYDVAWWAVVVLSYTFGCWFAFVLQACGHEGVHGNVFKSYTLNRIHGYFAFMPLWILPFENFWNPEHLHHHTIVVDKALRWGPRTSSKFVKIFLPLTGVFVVQCYLTIQAMILFAICLVSCVMYVLRLRSTPLPQSFFLKPFSQFPSMISFSFMFFCLTSTLFWTSWYSVVGIKGVAYMLLGSCWSNGLSPLGMRNVQEHLVKVKNQPTYSVYYSDAFEWLHPFLSLNINYHMEHHDFSNMPWNKLPKLRRIAPEFYENMNNYHSYLQVWREYLFDDGIPPSDFFDDLIPSESSTDGSKKDQ
jgi:sphingolipid delta-4 desaturase